jgi:alkylresorcinol/alkylpyrone synthase
VPVIAAAATALPEHRYAQADITEAFTGVMVGADGTTGDRALLRDVIRRTHEATTVESRHLVLSLDEYGPLEDFGKANDVFLREAPLLAAGAASEALAMAGLDAGQVDIVVTTTVTGVAVPSLDARLVPLLGLRNDIQRVPLMGLGCVAGAAGVARVADLLRGSPDSVALLVSAELCSLTLQHDDTSMANIVASGLFGDGAAAVVMLGDARAQQLGISGPRCIDAQAHFFDDTERVMGWDVSSTGLRVVLSPEVPQLVAAELPGAATALLSRHDLDIRDVATWVVHSGGPKVLDAIEASLGLGHDSTRLTWESLREVGNLSSASVLDVLARTLAQRTPSGRPAVMAAMGPGFCAELVLLEW